MATFDEQRRELGRWREEQESLRQKLLLARESVRRGVRDDDTVATLEGEVREQELRGAAIWKEFERFADPKEGLRRLEDRHPILLFPLRIETRFKTGAQGVPQLWVRVYPDQCLVDSFEPSLTEGEIENAQAFWAAVWRAGGVESEERAAWRDLAASHGSGRAGHIVKNYGPLNPDDQPLLDTEHDVLLIVTATDPLPAKAADFWTGVWRAGGDDAAILAARPALVSEVGEDAAQGIVEKFRPTNLADPPKPGADRETTPLKVRVALFPPAEQTEARRRSWSRAPRVDLLPERLQLLGYRGGQLVLDVSTLPIQTPLAVGPDPNAPPEQQLKPVGDTLQIPDDLAWMFDFERALKVGMAFRVDLTAEQAHSGFDRLLVLGVRLGDDAERGQKNLGTLLERHLHSRMGLELLPQGTPTNNTEQGGSGYRVHGDPEDGYTAFFKQEPLFTVQSDPLLRRDGQWFAHALGLPTELGQRLPNAGGKDQLEARAMNLALWPSTFGYMMRTMLQPIFGEETIDATRSFFSRYVLGRGGVPALRIGAQPYGILPTTAFGPGHWLAKPRQDVSSPLRLPNDAFTFVGRLYRVLSQVESDWEPLLDRVSQIGMDGNADPHQVLLDVLGLHAASVEYYPLKAESVSHKFHQLSFLSYPIALAMLRALTTKDEAMRLLRSFGYGGDEEPSVLKKLYSSRQPRLQGPVIDNGPLSETAPVAPCAGQKNYIEWLLEAAETDLDILQEERGFDAGKKPRALLYLMLRHALQLSFHLVAAREQVKSLGVVSVSALQAEPEYVHVRAGAQASESRYALLHEPAPNSNLRMADHISSVLRFIDPELTEQIASLERLARTPTARLERAFAEHIDCASYRLDAWKQGLLLWQLEQMRSARQGTPGTFIGAFGWLEEVRPENKVLTPVSLPPEIAELVNKPGDPPLVRDTQNLGLIHAPSINHATTAAVLRNGYVANDGRLAVDLSSRRVRLALAVLEGMRTGQPLGALLGYHFERHIHDSGSLSLRALVFGLRRKFPLVANRNEATRDETKAIEAIAAMNVVDGLKLLRQREESGVSSYPWGLSDLPETTEPSHGPALDAAAAYIADINDAVADLVLAEGVHQAVSGNFDRSAGTLDAFSKGNYPPEPEVIQTPRTGTALVLRTAVHLDPEPVANPAPTVPRTPLSIAEPSLNSWLTDRLPAAGTTGCTVIFRDQTDAEQTLFVSQEMLGLQAIDLVYQLEASNDAALRFVDDRVLDFVHRLSPPAAPRLDAPIRIEYTRPLTNGANFFELQALVRPLRAIATSRPLQPADLVRTNDSRAAELPPSVLNVARLVEVRGELRDTRQPGLTNLIAALPGGTIDAAIAAYNAEVSALSLYRLPQTGVGFTYEWRAGLYVQALAKLKKLTDRWRARLVDADAQLADYDANPGLPEEEKLKRLQTIELLVSTSYLDPVPANANDYRAAVGGKRSDYAAKLGDLDAIAQTRFATLDALLQALKSQSLAAFDFEGLDLTDEDKEVARFRTQLVDAATAIRADLQKRLDGAAVIDLSPLPIEKAQEAARLLLGEDFQMIPTFVLPTDAADGVESAWNRSKSGDLTRYLTDTVGREFPVDDWLHGVARVREKMAHWENVLFLSEALGGQAPELTPLQLPDGGDESWLALEFPPPASEKARAIDSDRLLYTAHFAKDFVKTKPICGLLVDEWTEVIPEEVETTGLAFHHDRPNSEPPQCWLLAQPAVLDGAWSWDELVGAVHNALDAAKRRAIEPSHIANTVYGWLLPATYSAYTFPEISISNYLLRNVNVFSTITSVKG
ncbi:MAG TPA: hypothetical protein VK421_07455 [Pyrinomonadaceae bacterium]|nr:hypothetical protein [Pyrinomonadaceae bacterium]